MIKKYYILQSLVIFALTVRPKYIIFFANKEKPSNFKVQHPALIQPVTSGLLLFHDLKFFFVTMPTIFSLWSHQ